MNEDLNVNYEIKKVIKEGPLQQQPVT